MGDVVHLRRRVDLLDCVRVTTDGVLFDTNGVPLNQVATPEELTELGLLLIKVAALVEHRQ